MNLNDNLINKKKRNVNYFFVNNILILLIC